MELSKPPLVENLIALYNRDLTKLKVELEAYEDESKLWIVEKSILNSAGNLTLHIIGNLNTFIGANLGGTSYVRQREKEFSSKDIPKQTLLKMTEECRQTVELSLSKLKHGDLEKAYRRNPFEAEMTTAYFLLHLYGHLSYHLGQINYHRRLLA